MDGGAAVVFLVAEEVVEEGEEEGAPAALMVFTIDLKLELNFLNIEAAAHFTCNGIACEF